MNNILGTPDFVTLFTTDKKQVFSSNADMRFEDTEIKIILHKSLLKYFEIEIRD